MSEYLSIKSRKERLVSEQIRGKIEKTYKQVEEEKEDYFSYKISNGKEIKIWKSTKNVDFINLPEMYLEYRMEDMKYDEERVESYNKTSPMLHEINFRDDVIGSDETGKGEVFKPFVFTAAYIKDVDELREYMQMGITDSKKIRSKVASIGEKITKIHDWKQIKDNVEKGELIKGDFFVTRIITNEELNKRCIKENENDIMRQAHEEVLSELYKKYPNSMLIVDDFMDTAKSGNHQTGERFKENFTKSIPKELPAPQMYLTTEGDAKVVAVGLASVISYYISELALNYVTEQFNSEIYNSQKTVVSARELNSCQSAEQIAKVLSNLKPEKKKVFVDKYAKVFFGSVQRALGMNQPEIVKTETVKPKTGSKFYAVRVGKTPGIYNTWADCEAQTKGYPGAKFKSFATYEEAEAFISGK